MRTNDITKKAGVTWGAAQHLFGSKDALLMQVATTASEALVEMLETDIDVDLASAEKLSRIIDCTWKLYNSKAYFAMVEIVRGTKKDPKINDMIVTNQSRITAKLERLWIQIFRDTGVSEDDILQISNLVVLFLSGLAARKIYFIPSAETDRQVDFITEVSRRELQRVTPP